MLSKEEVSGRWNEVKGRLQQRWSQLTEDDFQRARGTTNELVGVIEQKTGASRREIESFLSGILEEGEGFRQRVAGAAHEYAESAQHYAEEAGEYAREGYHRVASTSSDLSRRFVQVVRERPGASMAIAFGLGIAAGAFLLLGSREKSRSGFHR